METRHRPNFDYGYQSPPPDLIYPPPLHNLLPPPPSGFRPLSDAQISSLYPSGFLSPPDHHHCLPCLRGGPIRPNFHNPPSTCSPVAGRRGRPPATTGTRQSSVSASQPPYFRSPGRTPTSENLDVHKARQDRGAHVLRACQSEPQAERSKDDLFLLDDASFSTAEKHCSSEILEVEMSDFADSQDRRQEVGHLRQPSQGQEESQGLCKQIHMISDAPSTCEGHIRHEKLQELTSSMINEAESPVLAEFQEERQGHGSNKSLISPGKAELKRKNDQLESMTSEAGETREKRLQKLTSSKKNELEVAAVPMITVNKDSSCGVLSEVEKTVAPNSQMASIFQFQSESYGLTSSTLNWASKFDDVSTTAATYWGRDADEMVKVGNYFVEHKHSSTIDAIFKKYGDIAKDCQKTSTMFRSFALQGVCEVVMGLQIPLQQLSHRRLNKYSCFAKEVANLGLTVEWLEERLAEVSEIINYLKEYKHIRDMRKQNIRKIQDVKEEIRLMEIEKRKGENEVETLWCSFKAATLEVKKKESAINDIKSRCKAIPKRLLDGLY